MDKPNYYIKQIGNMRYECWDIIKIWIHGMTAEYASMMYNVLKYLWRFEHKNGIEDLMKARTYLDEIIRMKNEELNQE